MRAPTLLLVASLVLASGLGATIAEYLPLEPGNSWDYVDGTGTPLRISVASENPTMGCANVHAIVGGVITQAECDGTAGGELVMKAYADVSGEYLLDPPALFFREPLEPGASWSWSGRYVGAMVSIPSSITATVEGVEEVEAEGRTFEALRVHFLTVRGGEASEYDDYLAKGVGRVLMEGVRGGLPFSFILVAHRVAGSGAGPEPAPATPATPAPNGRPCRTGAECASDNCRNGVCCLAQEACCASSADCPEGRTCDGARSFCVASPLTSAAPAQARDNGAACAAPGECASGNCLSGVCCIAGRSCCSADRHCDAAERCDAARAYCVPAPSAAASAPPAPTMAPSTAARRKPIGAACTSGDECEALNCRFVCCLAGHACCAETSQCDVGEECDAERSFCVRKEAAQQPQPAEGRSSVGRFLDWVLSSGDLVQLGLLIGAVVVGAAMYLRKGGGSARFAEAPPQAGAGKGSEHCGYCGASFVRRMASCPHCGADLSADAGGKGPKG